MKQCISYLKKKQSLTGLSMFVLHLVLHPHGIAPTFLKLDPLSPGADYIPIISDKGIYQINKEKIVIKVKFYAY